MLIPYRRRTLDCSVAALFTLALAGCQQEVPKHNTGRLGRGKPPLAVGIDLDQLAPTQVVLAVEGMH